MENLNNKIILSGMVGNQPEYSHTCMGEKFYKFELLAARTSGAVDRLNCIISETMIGCVDKGSKVEVVGRISTYNRKDGDRTKLEISVFVQEVCGYEGDDDENKVTLTGFVCNSPAARKTPYGRYITDVILAVNRPYGKSDYIPMIVWGRNAFRAEKLVRGDCVQVVGRLQSRTYQKNINGNMETRTAYEVSAALLFMEDEGEKNEEN